MDNTEEPDDAFANDDNVQETDGEDTKDEPLTDLSAERDNTSQQTSPRQLLPQTKDLLNSDKSQPHPQT